jgi:hypothetical protein
VEKNNNKEIKPEEDQPDGLQKEKVNTLILLYMLLI